MVVYYSTNNFHSLEALVRLIDSKYTVSNMFVSRPTRLMGNAGILELRDVSKDRVIKIEGDSEKLDDLYELLNEK